MKKKTQITDLTTMNGRIKHLRIVHDLSQETVAEILNISIDSYGKYERGVNSIPIDIIPKLAVLYNSNLDYIFGIEKKDSEFDKIMNRFDKLEAKVNNVVIFSDKDN